MVNKNRVGLFFAVIFAVAYVLWIIMVVAGWAQPVLDWMMSLDHFSMTYTLMPVDYAKAVLGLVVAFVGGYVKGFILAWFWNWIVGKR